MSIILGTVWPWMVGHPRMAGVVVIALLAFFYYSFAGAKRPYCYARIRERRGDILYDHAKVYPCFIKSQVDPESSRKIMWLQIGTPKLLGAKFVRYWKVPRAEDLTPTVKGQRFIELAWFGGNNFQLMKVTNHVFKPIETELFKRNKNNDLVKVKETKLYKKEFLDNYALDIVPEDLKLLDYELDKNINNFMKSSSWWNLVDKYAVLVIIALVCFAMVYVTTKNISKELSDTRKEFRSFGDRFIEGVKEASSRQMDSKTTVVTNVVPEESEGGG